MEDVRPTWLPSYKRLGCWVEKLAVRVRLASSTWVTLLCRPTSVNWQAFSLSFAAERALVEAAWGMWSRRGRAARGKHGVAHCRCLGQ